MTQTDFWSMAGGRAGTGVQVVGTTEAPPEFEVKFTAKERVVLEGARATLQLLARLGQVDAWAVARFTERNWTSLAFAATPLVMTRSKSLLSSQAVRSEVGIPVPRESTLAHHLITGPSPVVVSDLASCTVPGVPQLAAQWGFRSFLGIGLVGPEGRLLGTLEAMSTVQVDLDPAEWAPMLIAQGRSVESILFAEFATLGTRRKTLHEHAMLTADTSTRLPDRRGWGVLLAGEEELTTPLGCPVGVVLVDLGVVRTVRAMRRAVGVVEKAFDGHMTARVGPRQLGVLAGGLDQAGVETMATVAQSRLEGAGFRTATAYTMRAGLEPLSDTWLRAEHALITARRKRLSEAT